MLDLITPSSTRRRISYVIVFAVVVGIALISTQDHFFGNLVALLVVGGVITGALFVALHAIAHRPLDQTVVDRFDGDNIGNIINVSRIRVTGIGGLGMVAMALAIAAAIPPIRVSMALALVGGVCFALALISYRRAHAARHP